MRDTDDCVTVLTRSRGLVGTAIEHFNYKNTSSYRVHCWIVSNKCSSNQLSCQNIWKWEKPGNAFSRITDTVVTCCL